MSGLRIGYLLPTRDAAVAGDPATGPLLDLARRAEALGFDSLWLGDSPLVRPRHDALALLAALAVATRRPQLGTAVLLPALRDPLLLAHQLATIDQLSNGRLVVGAGAGFAYPPTQAQFEAVGRPYAGRVRLLEETIAAWRVLWASPDEPVSFAGRHVAFRDVRLAGGCAQPGGPQIWLAGSGGPAERRVGTLGDGWLPYPPTPAAYRKGLDRIRVAAIAAGRDAPTPALYATVAMVGDADGALARLRASIELSYDAPLEVIASLQALIAGPPAQIAAELGEYVAAGARHVILRVAGADAAAALEQVGEHLLPRLREQPAVRVAA